MILETENIVLLAVVFCLSLIGFWLYLLMSRKFTRERAVREETAERHAAKSKIPDMAGVVMLVVYALVALYTGIKFITGEFEGVWQSSSRPMIHFLVVPLLFGVLGLLDDLVKNYTRKTRGIPARIRILIQLVIAIWFVYEVVTGNEYEAVAESWVIIYVILLVIFLLATVNAANFTDGLDGLLTGTAIFPVIGMLLIIPVFNVAGCLLYPARPIDSNVISIFCGILLAFMIFNKHPAKMFMGDGGSMFIGGFMGTLAILNNMIIPMLFMACVIYFELISVVLQVISVRLTGRRIFLMTPIHHAFEKLGWKESTIVIVFSFIALITSITGVLIWRPGDMLYGFI